MRATSYERFAGLCAILAGLSGLLYSIAFIILKNPLLYGLFMLLGGLFAGAALVGLYHRLSSAEADFALWALLLGILATAGSMIHGSYDLANAINPPVTANLDLPFQVDPRGLLTFAVAGVSLLVFSWIITGSRVMPPGLGYLGYVSAILLVVVYLGRLIVLQPANPVLLVPAALEGFIVNPVWYVWLGLSLRGAK